MEHTNRVLILYTGGILGMTDSPAGYVPAPGLLAELLAAMPQFHDRTMPALTTPLSRYGRRIHYSVVEYEPLLAAGSDAAAWTRIARSIEAAYAEHDAFVVVHPTPTLAYTASALSFMLENLGKTVIVTGSQVPLAEARGDAQANLLGALTIAGHYAIPEVCVYFGDRLLRGNRTRRVAEGFASEGFPPLVQVGAEIRVEWERILAPPSRPFRVLAMGGAEVAAVRMFPGMSAELLTRVLQAPLAGAVLESFDMGALAGRGDLLAVLGAACKRGVVIVNVAQGARAGAGEEEALAGVGVVSGADLTPEAALTKLGHLLGRHRDRAEVGRLMAINLRGELTAGAQQNRFSFRERVFIASVARALAEAGESVTRVDVERALLPVLMCSAAGLGDTTALERLIASGAEVDAADYDGRTALHLAAAEGQLAAASLLLGKGARVGVVDRWGETPIVDAVRHRQRPLVALLVSRGARVSGNHSPKLCALAAAGDIEGLGLWIEAGADPSGADYDGRTPLHLAAAEGRGDALQLLLACGADPRRVDRFGSTPIEEARRGGHQAALSLLASHLATAT